MFQILAFLNALLRGMERGKLLLLCLRERGGDFFKAPFAHLSKVVFFLAKMNASVVGSKGLVGPIRDSSSDLE